MRGDGRHDYAYNGWVLYADTVQPPRLPASGGPIVIRGMGFRPSDTVLIGGQKAVVTSVSPNEITAIAPAAAPGTTGSVDVEVERSADVLRNRHSFRRHQLRLGHRRFSLPQHGSGQHCSHRCAHPVHCHPRSGQILSPSAASPSPSPS